MTDAVLGIDVSKNTLDISLRGRREAALQKLSPIHPMAGGSSIAWLTEQKI